MQVLSKIDETQNIVKSWQKQGLKVGLVPTMGALHVGHMSLVKEAKKHCDKVVVSIFVNPTQFGPNEDFEKYPRTFEQDKESCENLGVDLIFAPTVTEMYPDYNKCSQSLTMVVPPVEYVDKLCGKSRVGHFDGVATIVLKLFNMVQPDKAFFGQKDAQQLIIIKKMCRDLNVPVQVIGCPIIRESTGLACSSRNTYLSENDRQKASTLYMVLKNVVKLYNQGCKDKKTVFADSLNLLDKDFELEYLEAYDSETLEYVESMDDKTLIAIAARLSNVRLIDNVILGLENKITG